MDGAVDAGIVQHPVQRDAIGMQQPREPPFARQFPAVSLRGGSVREARAHQPVEAHAFLCRLQHERPVRLRRNTDQELTAVRAVRERRRRGVRVGVHVREDLVHERANSGERFFGRGGQPTERRNSAQSPAYSPSSGDQVTRYV